MFYRPDKSNPFPATFYMARVAHKDGDYMPETDLSGDSREDYFEGFFQATDETWGGDVVDVWQIDPDGAILHVTEDFRKWCLKKYIAWALADNSYNSIDHLVNAPDWMINDSDFSKILDEEIADLEATIKHSEVV
jgi:hypothetical protein